MLSFLVTLVILIIIFALLFYLIDLLPGDATIKQIGKVVLILVLVLYLLGMLFGQSPVLVLPR